MGIANGLVRCGVCDESFLALGRLYEHLDDVPADGGTAQPVPALHEEQPDSRMTSAPVRGADEGRSSLGPGAEDLESNTAPPGTVSFGAGVEQELAPGYRVEPEPAEEGSPGQQPEGAQAQRSEPLMPADIAMDEADAGAQLHLPADDMPPVLKADLQAQALRRSPAKLVAGVLAVLLLLVGLAVQYVYYQRAFFVENPVVRPWMARACATLGCALPLPHDAQRIELLSREVRSDPDVSHALLISAVFVNRAPYRQAYPLLGLRFSNFAGTLIAARYFRPVEYLPATVDPAKGIASGATARVRFVISDPGAAAVSYQFNFR